MDFKKWGMHQKWVTLSCNHPIDKNIQNQCTLRTQHLELGAKLTNANLVKTITLDPNHDVLYTFCTLIDFYLPIYPERHILMFQFQQHVMFIIN